jgi:HSP20 family molecular chaperone IbpA
MFFATTAPTDFRSQICSPTARSLERFMEETQWASRQKSCAVTQDDSAFTLTFDVPGVSRDQLNIGLEGNIVRMTTKEDAPRQYKQAYELPQDIDAGSSEAKLENGVLTLKLAKQVPVSKVTELVIH